jgi:hypothetical protein
MNHLPPTLLLMLVGVLTITNVRAVDANGLMEQIKQRMQRVTSYTADLKIKIDISFMKVPEAKAKISFVSPDKTTIEAPGFAMLPKQGADLNALKLLSKPYVAVDAGSEMFQGVRMRKVKVIPADEESDIAVATVYVDTTQMVARKIVTTSRKGGTATAELVYDHAQARNVGLPSYIKLMFDVGAFDLPKTMTGDFESNRTQGTGNGERGTESEGRRTSDAGRRTTEQAVVEIWYSGYVIKQR